MLLLLHSPWLLWSYSRNVQRQNSYGMYGRGYIHLLANATDTSLKCVCPCGSTKYVTNVLRSGKVSLVSTVTTISDVYLIDKFMLCFFHTNIKPLENSFHTPSLFLFPIVFPTIQWIESRGDSVYTKVCMHCGLVLVETSKGCIR